MRTRPTRKPKRGPRLAQLPQLLSQADWPTRGLFALANLLPLGLMIGWAFLVPDAWDGARARLAGIPGTMSVERCDNGIGKGSYLWFCTGTFTTANLRLDEVEAHTFSLGRPGSSLHGRVSGPGADEVWVDGEIGWLAEIGFTLALPALAWWLSRGTMEILKPPSGRPKAKTAEARRGSVAPD